MNDLCAPGPFRLGLPGDGAAGFREVQQALSECGYDVGRVMATRATSAFALAPAYDSRMAEITPKDARNYLNRWSLVREVEDRELRAASMELKARQLSALMASRGLFSHDSTRDQEIVDVRARWARIRSTLSG